MVDVHGPIRIGFEEHVSQQEHVPVEDDEVRSEGPEELERSRIVVRACIKIRQDGASFTTERSDRVRDAGNTAPLDVAGLRNHLTR
jgi:hypothetical protein